jgi:hypothetical protein
MPASYLAINMRSTTPVVKTLNGLSPTTIGTSPGTAEAFTTTQQPLNRVIQFGNATTFLVLINGTVRRSTDSGTSWTTVLSFSPVNTNKTGLNVVSVNGVPTVCFVSADTSTTTYKGYYSTDGISWTTEGPFSGAGVAAGQGMYGDTVYRNSLYAAGVTGSWFTIIYTPGSGVSFITALATAPQFVGFCVFNDNLYAISRAQAGVGTTPVYQLSAGNWVLAVTLTGGSGNMADLRPGAFVDGSFMYVFSAKVAGTSWGCWKVASDHTFTDISTTVLPIGMQSGASATSRCLTWVDGSLNPGADPSKYLIYSNGDTATDTLTLFKWVDASTTMTNIDAGSNNAEALSTAKNVGGQNFWVNGENSVNLISRTGILSGIRLSFQLFSTTGTPTVNVRGFFGNVSAEYPTTACTLINPSSGSMSGNTITGLVVDNGVTTFQVTWSSTTDGIAAGDRFRLILEVYI